MLTPEQELPKMRTPEPPHRELLVAMSQCDTSAALKPVDLEITMGDVGSLARSYMHIERELATYKQMARDAVRDLMRREGLFSGVPYHDSDVLAEFNRRYAQTAQRLAGEGK